MPITPISSATSGIKPIEMPNFENAQATKANGADFSNKLNGAIENLQETQTNVNKLSMEMATGQLADVHDYMIAANEAQVATQLTVAVKNKAVESFNQIMNMQV